MRNRHTAFILSTYLCIYTSNVFDSNWRYIGKLFFGRGVYTIPTENSKYNLDFYITQAGAFHVSFYHLKFNDYVFVGGIQLYTSMFILYIDNVFSELFFLFLLLFVVFKLDLYTAAGSTRLYLHVCYFPNV